MTMNTLMQLLDNTRAVIQTDDAWITPEEVAHLLALAARLSRDGYAPVPLVSAAPAQTPLLMAASHKSCAPARKILAPLPMAAAHTSCAPARKILAPLPMAASHSFCAPPTKRRRVDA